MADQRQARKAFGQAAVREAEPKAESSRQSEQDGAVADSDSRYREGKGLGQPPPPSSSSTVSSDSTSRSDLHVGSDAASMLASVTC